MLKFFLQTEQQVENLIVPDSVQKARFAQAVKDLATIDIKDVWQQIAEWVIWTGIKICISLVIFYIGRWLLHKFVNIVGTFLERRNIDLSLRSFATTATKVLGYAALFIVIFNILGFESSSVLAIFASMGLAGQRLIRLRPRRSPCRPPPAAPFGSPPGGRYSCH